MDVYGIARLTKDIELKQTKSGIPFANFSIAADRDYQSKEEKQSDFFECQAWRGTAEFLAKWFKKGDPVFIKGELQTDKWQTEDGQNRTKTYIRVEKAKFVPSKKSDTTNTAQAAQPVQTGTDNGRMVQVDEPLPF